MVPLILLFCLFSLSDTSNYYGYEYQAKITKLADPFLNTLNYLDDLFHKSQFKTIYKNFSASLISSLVILSDITENYSFFQSPECSVNLSMINNSYCHQTKCGRNSFISIFDFNYQIRFMNSLRYMGKATAILNTDSLSIIQCFNSQRPTLEFNFSGKSIIQNLTGASIRSKIPIEIASVFDDISSQITDIVQPYLNTKINLNTIEFMSNTSFPIDDQVIIISNNLNSISSYNDVNFVYYIFFNYNSTISLKNTQINETISDVSVFNNTINKANSSQICSSMHLAIAAMNLISKKGKYNFQLNTTKMGIGKYSVEYFDIIPEFSSNLNGNEMINIFCSKKPDEKISYITPPSLQFNYSLYIPLVCLFTLDGTSKPFLESNMSVITQTKIKVDSLQDAGFKLQFYYPNLYTFNTH